jgi:hypothetical protein
MAVPAPEALTTVTAKSPHVSDPSLQPFLQPTFDPAAFLNSTLPSLLFATHPQSAKGASSPNVNLPELSSQTQALLSQLNAQTSRLTAVLTQLTDDILRSGARLAYEVDVLRGEAIGLSEALNEGLQDDIALFTAEKVSPPAEAGGVDDVPLESSGEPDKGQTSDASNPTKEPAYIRQLRTLSHVKRRLESVIKVFGEAMQWSLPPSEVSLTSSFISVSGPEPGSDSHSREEKGREFAESLRAEIADLIVTADSRAEGREAASARIAALRDLADVWKGTAEEKARIRFVEGLANLADNRLRELERDDGSKFRDSRTASPRKAGTSNKSGRSDKGMGFLDNLHRMRSNISFE